MSASFEALSLSAGLQVVVSEMGYQNLTSIQLMTIPRLMAGKDVVGQSQTGSGKTVAFAIPILEQIQTKSRTTQALVICPTRELSQQVAREIRKLGRYRRDLRLVVLCGGYPVYHDRRALEHGTHILVGTPGRLLDHLGQETIDLGGIRTVVLDEADRMLDMGFREKIENILAKTPKGRQTALFSATFPKTIESLSRRYQRSPERISVDLQGSDAPAIEQIFVRAQDAEKPNTILSFLKGYPMESVLVFCNLKVRVDELVHILRKAGLSAERLHGDLDQYVRDRVMAKFRNHTTKILVATDVAARGIDIEGLDAVINCDLPNDPEQYIHRIGRTGRAGKSGLALSLVTPIESEKHRRIAEVFKKDVRFTASGALPRNKSDVCLSKLDTLAISGGRKDKLRPGDILGALTRGVGLKGEQIGKIEILDRTSFVAIDRMVSRVALSGLRKGHIKNRRFLIDLLS